MLKNRQTLGLRKYGLVYPVMACIVVYCNHMITYILGILVFLSLCSIFVWYYPVSYVQGTKTCKFSQTSYINKTHVSGIAGLIIACAIGAYKFKHRGSMSTSLFLMQLRVAAQGTVVGCLALGVTYSMLKDYVWKPLKKEQ